MSYIDINGVRTYYEEAGRGRPLVFLHGTDLNLTYWKPEFEFFSKQYRAVAYDWRGMGKSSGANVPYQFSQLVADLTTFLDKLNIDNPILCGHSEGGMIVLQYAVTTTRPISALVLADTAGPHNVNVGPLSYKVTKLVIDFFSKIPFFNPLRPLVPIYKDNLYSSDFRESDPQAIKRWEKQFLSMTGTAVNIANRAQAFRPNITKQLDKITQPTLLLRGSEDQIVSMDETETYQSEIAGSQLQVIDDSGHMTLEEQPQAFIQSMEDFLSK